MKRLVFEPRPDWQAKAEARGYSWHSEGGVCSWNETAAYALTIAEVETLRERADGVHAMYLLAVEKVVHEGWWQRLGIRDEHVPVLRASYEKQEWSLAGRFDFMLDEHGVIKLIEFNADAALTLVETAVFQREWQREVMPDLGQFNQLHSSLVAAWSDRSQEHVHLAWRPRHREVEHTMRYLASIIREAGAKATLMALHCLGWNSKRGVFVDGDNEEVRCCYKIYPWAWMLEESFVRHVPRASCQFVEPAWRHLLSSKAMLAVLWELFPGHPALLPCYDDASRVEGRYVSKPLFGREGHNITICSESGVLQQSDGEFADERCIHQQMAVSPRFDGFIPQFGVWMVGRNATALGMRETDSLIINADSPFTPHVVENG